MSSLSVKQENLCPKCNAKTTEILKNRKNYRMTGTPSSIWIRVCRHCNVFWRWQLKPEGRTPSLSANLLWKASFIFFHFKDSTRDYWSCDEVVDYIEPFWRANS